RLQHAPSPPFRVPRPPPPASQRAHAAAQLVARGLAETDLCALQLKPIAITDRLRGAALPAALALGGLIALELPEQLAIGRTGFASGELEPAARGALAHGLAVLVEIHDLGGCARAGDRDLRGGGGRIIAAEQRDGG